MIRDCQLQPNVRLVPVLITTILDLGPECHIKKPFAGVSNLIFSVSNNEFHVKKRQQKLILFREKQFKIQIALSVRWGHDISDPQKQQINQSINDKQDQRK